MSNKLYYHFEQWISTPKATGYLKVLVGLLVLGGVLTACNANSAVAMPEPASAGPTQSNYAGKRILWVDSYHQSYEWSDGIEAGVKDVLNGTGVELKIVRMDTKRNPEVEFGQQAGISAKAEIEAFKPDVIIASDDNAQKYLIVPYFKDTDIPVIFNGVNWDASSYGYPANNMTGMVEVELPAQLVEQLKGYAKGNRLGYLTVDSETERKIAQIYNERFFDNQMNEYWVKTFDEFKEVFLKAQEEVDILFIGNNAGLDRWDETEAKKFFTENTTIPTGAINPWMAPYSLITLAKSPEEQGEWSAKTALSILDGTPASEIPVTKNKRGVVILNLDMADQLEVVFSPSLVKNAEIYSSKQ